MAPSRRATRSSSKASQETMITEKEKAIPSGKKVAESTKVQSGDEKDSSPEEEVSGEEEEEEEDREESEEEDREDSEEEGDGSEEDESGVKSKQGKQQKKDPRNNLALASSLTHILGKTLKSKEAQAAPILARSGVEKRLREDQLEGKARKILRQEKKREKDMDRVKPQPEGMDYEKKLKKVATRGVVQLFNAIRMQQQSSVDVGNVGSVAKAESAHREAAKMDKANFLSLLKGDASSSKAE